MTDETSRLPDPVFAAIEAFKAAGDAFDIAYDVQESASDRDRPTAQRALDVASAAFADARETFLNVPPTTIERIAALLIFVSNEPDIAEWLIHASDHVEAMRFFHTLARSVCALAGLPEPPPPGGLVIPFKPKT